MNPMQEVRLEKVTLNIGTGGPGEPLNKALKLLNIITQTKPVATTTQKRIPTWGLRPGLQIGCKVTVRGKKAEELLKRLLAAKSNKLSEKCVDQSGNLSFGIPEYLDIPGVEYDVSVGIMGLEVAVSLKKNGFRIKNRQLQTRKIPLRHRVSKEEAKNFMKTKYNIIFEVEE